MFAAPIPGFRAGSSREGKVRTDWTDRVSCVAPWGAISMPRHYTAPQGATGWQPGGLLEHQSAGTTRTNLFHEVKQHLGDAPVSGSVAAQPHAHGFQLVQMGRQPLHAGPALHQEVDPWNVAIVFVVRNTTADGVPFCHQDLSDGVNIGLPVTGLSCQSFGRGLPVIAFSNL